VILELYIHRLILATFNNDMCICTQGKPILALRTQAKHSIPPNPKLFTLARLGAPAGNCGHGSNLAALALLGDDNTVLSLGSDGRNVDSVVSIRVVRPVRPLGDLQAQPCPLVKWPMTVLIEPTWSFLPAGSSAGRPLRPANSNSEKKAVLMPSASSGSPASVPTLD
jgi:hypothetical protein